MRVRRDFVAFALMALAGCSSTGTMKPSVLHLPPPDAGVAMRPHHAVAGANRACHDPHPRPLRVSSAAPRTVGVGGGPHANLDVATPKALVALSFDDGPTVAYTPRVLRLLARAKARATFFDIGRSAALHPTLIAREVRSHDEVANHTYTHTQLARTGVRGAIRLPQHKIAQEIASARIALCRAGARDPRLFRPPYGRGVFAPSIAALAASQGERVVGWDLALEHFIDNASPLRASVAALLTRVRPGSIILAHDGPALRERTIRALPLLLKGLRQLGYRIVSITDLLRSGVVVRSPQSDAGRATSVAASWRR